MHRAADRYRFRLAGSGRSDVLTFPTCISITTELSVRKPAGAGGAYYGSEAGAPIDRRTTNIKSLPEKQGHLMTLRESRRHDISLPRMHVQRSCVTTSQLVMQDNQS